MGRVTVPQHRGDELESIAIAHAYLKAIGRRAPDRFTITRHGWGRRGNHWTNVATECPPVQSGSIERLDREHCRTMVIRQNVTATVGIRVPVFITVVYDRHNIAFVDVGGHCLYISRSDIITPFTANDLYNVIGNPDNDTSIDDEEGIDVVDN